MRNSKIKYCYPGLGVRAHALPFRSPPAVDVDDDGFCHLEDQRLRCSSWALRGSYEILDFGVRAFWSAKVTDWKSEKRTCLFDSVCLWLSGRHPTRQLDKLEFSFSFSNVFFIFIFILLKYLLEFFHANLVCKACFCISPFNNKAVSLLFLLLIPRKTHNFLMLLCMSYMSLRGINSWNSKLFFLKALSIILKAFPNEWCSFCTPKHEKKMSRFN